MESRHTRSFHCLAFSLVLLAIATAASAGDLTGTVTYKGIPPPPIPVPLDKNPDLKSVYPNGLTKTLFEVGPNAGLKDVLVYLDGDFPRPSAPDPLPAPVTLHAKNGVFQPRVIGLYTNQSIELDDGDGCGWIAKAKTNAGFIYAFKKQYRHGFSKPELPIMLTCDMHSWNYSYVGVFDHPWFAVSAADGAFRLTNVPPGKYKVTAWHRHGGTLQTEAEVPASGDATWNFVFPKGKK